jgi:xanthine dehydrogenase YagR molybdenum-binding subunit
VTAAFTGRDTPADDLRGALESGVETLLLAEADRAAERTVTAWRGLPGGMSLLAGREEELEGVSPSFTGAAADAVRDWQDDLGVPETGAVDLHSAVATAGGTRVEVEATTVGVGQPAEPVVDRLRKGLVAIAGPEYPGFVTFSYIAHFVEVRVEPTTCRIRVPRVVSVADCGRVASPVTATSQVRGGVIWGIGATLREQSLVDPRYGGFLNSTMEEYPIVVNADVHQIDVHCVDEPDPLLNPVGVKGLGEVAMVGVSAAIGNAVFHATGTRFRRLPIRIEDVLASL